MYIAVDTYKNRINIDNHFLCSAIIIICVMVFILAGFEHSIADIFYFVMSGRLKESVVPLLLITLGNSIGSNVIPLILKLIKKDE